MVQSLTTPYRWRAALLVLVLLAPGTLGQELREEALFDPRGTWRFALDNDTFADSDDDYTSGVQVGWVSGYLGSFDEAPIWGGAGRWFDGLSIFERERQQRFFSYSLSHRIFTPSDITDPDPVDGADLPYSASLCLTATAGAQNDETMDALSFVVGVVGPIAGGEAIQNGVHDLIGSKAAEGWDTQIDNELLLNVGYERRWRLWRHGSSVDWLVSLSGSAGNLLTMATAGTAMRFGWNLPDDPRAAARGAGRDRRQRRVAGRARSHPHGRRLPEVSRTGGDAGRGRR